MAAVGNKMLEDCLKGDHKFTMNVVLLEDDTYAWSRRFVEAAVKDAIRKDRQENINHGTDQHFLNKPVWTSHSEELQF